MSILSFTQLHVFPSNCTPSPLSSIALISPVSHTYTPPASSPSSNSPISSPPSSLSLIPGPSKDSFQNSPKSNVLAPSELVILRKILGSWENLIWVGERDWRFSEKYWTFLWRLEVNWELRDSWDFKEETF